MPHYQDEPQISQKECELTQSVLSDDIEEQSVAPVMSEKPAPPMAIIESQEIQQFLDIPDQTTNIFEQYSLLKGDKSDNQGDSQSQLGDISMTTAQNDNKLTPVDAPSVPEKKRHSVEKLQAPHTSRPKRSACSLLRQARLSI